MGRLWQTLILMQENAIFEYLPIESEIKNTQLEYYSVLSQADQEGISTRFVTYMLGIIKKSLEQLILSQNSPLTDVDRLQYFQEHSTPRRIYQKRLPAYIQNHFYCYGQPRFEKRSRDRYAHKRRKSTNIEIQIWV